GVARGDDDEDDDQERGADGDAAQEERGGFFRGGGEVRPGGAGSGCGGPASVRRSVCFFSALMALCMPVEMSWGRHLVQYCLWLKVWARPRVKSSPTRRLPHL